MFIVCHKVCNMWSTVNIALFNGNGDWRRMKVEIDSHRAEVQRDEALQNFIEAQETLEDYQKKAKDKTRKVKLLNNWY